MIGATDFRKVEMRLSQVVMLKRDDPRRHDKFSVRVLSDEELRDWKTRIIDNVQTEIASQLKLWGYTDESQLTTDKIYHLDGMKEQISDITLLLEYREQKRKSKLKLQTEEVNVDALAHLDPTDAEGEP